MSSDPKEFISQIFTMPYGDIIASVGEGVAEAQRALDEGSLAATLDLYDSEADVGTTQEILQAIGYQPQYYGVRNVKGHLKMALSFQAEGNGARLWGTPMNPVVTGKYSYDAKASSELQFEIVPIPPAEQIRRVPNILEERLIDSDDPSQGKERVFSPVQAQARLDVLGLSSQFVDEEGASVVELVDKQIDDLVSHAVGDIVNIDAILTISVK